MACINSDKFSASDLCLFIESIETITQMEKLKQERQQQSRAQHLAHTLRYLDQQYPARSSSTLSSTDDPEDESVLENVEEKEIVYTCHYAVKDLIYDTTYEDRPTMSCANTTCSVQNIYCKIDCNAECKVGCQLAHDSSHSDIYNTPLDSMESTRVSNAPSASDIYEQISPLKMKSFNTISSDSYVEPQDIEVTPHPIDSSDSYEEPVDVVRKKSLKRTILGLVCKKYRQRFVSSNSNNWCKSESWMQLRAV